METVEITDLLIVQGQLFKDMQADFRENKRREAEIHFMKKRGQMNYKRSDKSIVMKNLTDKLSIELESYEQVSNLKI
jgi:TPP-dependent 2-oxoacid decarboxylase